MNAAAAAARAERRVALAFVTPALGVIALVALVPIGATAWEALHLHDLRLPWLGRPFIGAANFAEALGDRRFTSALWHSVAFAIVSVPLELGLGLALAWLMHTVVRGRGIVRVAAFPESDLQRAGYSAVWRLS